METTAVKAILPHTSCLRYVFVISLGARCSSLCIQFPTPLAANEEQAVIGNVRAIASREQNGINGASPSSVTESLAKTVLREKAAQFDPENHLLSCNSCRKVRASPSAQALLLIRAIGDTWCSLPMLIVSIQAYVLQPRTYRKRLAQRLN